jgi:hypothetical protein
VESAHQQLRRSAAVGAAGAATSGQFALLLMANAPTNFVSASCGRPVSSPWSGRARQTAAIMTQFEVVHLLPSAWLSVSAAAAAATWLPVTCAAATALSLHGLISEVPDACCCPSS